MSPKEGGEEIADTRSRNTMLFSGAVMYHPQVLFVKIVKFPRAGNVGATKVIF